MLEFRNVRAEYDGVERLRDISVRLEDGRLTAIIGPNGSGKTTLLRCAAGIKKSSGGEILLDGVLIRDIPERERARFLSYMPQHRAAPELSVRQLAMHGRYPHLKWGKAPGKMDHDIVEMALIRARMAENAARAVGSLSGGERQRAYLAMMFAQQTKTLLLDEPAAGLDLSSQFELMEILRQLRDEGRCVVVVMHDLAQALENCDTILLMEGGSLATAGSPEEIFVSGELGRVFGVDARRTEDGKYVFYPAGKDRI